ncbi:MAG: hypothetical protein ABIR17_09450 [Pseudolysinimonas sp.]|uniref:hypothetical protein n=1 Tax=Pseudolysinimonas sp. TaxID=2680009 RepID=UPI003263AD52
MEFLRSDEGLIKGWEATSAEEVKFATGDLILTNPPPEPFAPNVAWSAPDNFHWVDFAIGKYVDGIFETAISGEFRDEGVSGRDWLDQGGNLVAAHC